jgi:hypothetical protein
LVEGSRIAQYHALDALIENHAVREFDIERRGGVTQRVEQCPRPDGQCLDRKTRRTGQHSEATAERV